MEKFEQIKTEKFLPEEFNKKDIAKYSEVVRDSYFEHFTKNGYEKKDSVDVAAKDVDSSVLFIGSTISALKPLYLNNEVPENGAIIDQPCIRTQNLKNIYSEKPNKGNTVFELVGGIAPENKFSDVYNLSLKYFYENLKIEKDRLFVKASSLDKDILKGMGTESEGPEIELDSRKQGYYRWKYGIEGVVGRGMAFGVRNKHDASKSMTLGNIIIMESDNYPSTVQWGYGVGSIISGKYSKERVIDGSLISQVVPFSEGENAKFADSLAAVIEMYNSGLEPSNRGADSYLKAYLRGLAYWASENKIEKDEIIEYVEGYCELRNIPNSDLISSNIIQEIEFHKLQANKVFQKYKDKGVDDINRILNSEKEISKISNKFKIHPKEVKLIINNLR
ncbi:MAG: alanine--tRNA ligase-related protein [bacterium]